MRTEEIKIYNFEELSVEAQEKAIEDTRNSEGYLDYEWYDFLYEDFHEKLEEIGVSCKTFYWDLYHNNFYLDSPNIDDIKKFIKKAGAEKILILKNLEVEKGEYWDEIEDGLYSAGIVSEEYRTDVYDSGIDELDEILTEKLQEILNGFLNSLKESFDYLNSDEAVKEHLIINEYEFEEDGGRY